ncbi:MAG: chromosome segregation protein SMC [Clostridiales bacterium]|nr:chromosome segregation protein SMC [Clostridiales bacterium]
MVLKSLELHGFKSFPDRTVLKFSGGTTVIVGPNGSGKSNITDAMRWVLGELSSKNIRGSKMEDVIFAGADDVKPMSFAEVSVTFDDSEEPRTLLSPYEEVTITRRYYRSGDSEYFINRRKCRLKDISRLFLDTGVGREGYSIIGQGRIAEIISKRSEDRRGIFEESAGISRFRYQKSESEKKLAETEANMARVADIEQELASRIGPLERDSEKARKYLELYHAKEKTDVSLWLYDEERIKTAIQKSEADTELSKHELEMAEDSVKVTDAQIERLSDQSHDNKEASRRNYEETADATKKMNAAESDAKVLSKERGAAENALATETGLRDAAESTRAQEEERLGAIRASIAAIEEEYAETEEKFAAESERIADLGEAVRNKTEILEDLLEKQQKAQGRLTDLRVRLNVLENSISSQKKRSESIAAEIQKHEDDIAACDKICRDAEEQISLYRAEIEKIAESLAGVTQKIAEERETAGGIESERRERRAALDSCESRISALTRMQEHFEGFSNSVRYIMNEARAGRLTGIRGPLSTLISVEPKYIVAIETSLGGALQNIVTEDEYAAKAAIEALKKGGAGRATFYPMTTIRAAQRNRDEEGAERAAGFIGWGDGLVKTDDAYRAILSSLLARVAVFDNLDNAIAAAKNTGWRLRAVTLDGQQTNIGGSLTGGQTRRDSGILSRSAEIEALRAEADGIAKALAKLDRRAKDSEERIALIAAGSRGEEERRSLIEALIGAEEKTYSDADGRRKTLLSLVADMKNDSRSLDESNAKSADDLAGLKTLIEAEAETVKTVSDKRAEIAGERGAAELEIAGITDRANEYKIRLAELTRDREAADRSAEETGERIRAAEEERDRRRANADALAERIRSLEEQAGERRREAEELREVAESLGGRQKQIDETGDAIEEKLNALRQTLKERTAKKELTFIAHSKNEARLTSLKEEETKLGARMWEDYELTYATAVRFAEENDCHVIVEGERTRYQAMQTELKNKLRALGNVNVAAIEEYNEVKKRYDHIKTQLDDLRASKDDLEGILSSIAEDMKKMFLEAFEKINRYFGEVFRELFGGGHAEVLLADPENPLESGIEIVAAPPGKTIKNLNLLSGGEQAFIAIALLFALIRVNPSPFCIFDEIEAALDEVNVGRVGRYIKKVSEQMQIIMISHRRGTMDIADTLYGVTMQKPGVSKVFTLGAGDGTDTLFK